MSENITPEVSQADLDSVMRKYDRESNTRIWTGKPKIAITLILAAFSIWCIYVTLFATFLEEIRLTSFMALIILMGFLIYPDRKDQIRPNYIPIYDIIFMIAGSGAFLYYTFNANQIINQGTRFEWYQIIIGIIGILALVEITRRCVGIPILCVAGFFLIYALSYGLTNPAFFGRVKYLVRNLFYTKEGILATPVNVCSKYIVVFIIFGAFLERTGISNFFIDMANSIAGRFAGGPAKVAVISSALCGMVSLRHGLRFFGRQHRDHRFRYHSHDEEDRLSERVRRRGRSGFLHRRPDHAAHHGRRRFPDGGLYRCSLR